MKGNPKSQAAIPDSFARIGKVTSQPLFWNLVAAVLAIAGGRKGKRAAKRGMLYYLLGALLGNAPKPLFSRPQPRHRWVRKPQVARGSFPSGHSAAEAAFVFGAAQEIPASFLPLGIPALLGHLSLIKDGKHYVSDVIAGFAIGLGISLGMGKAWPPERKRSSRLEAGKSATYAGRIQPEQAEA